MDDLRPNPEALLASVQNESARAHRGRLKIFFGYAAGVGKTFAMLQAAQRELAEGREVIVGYVEPHNRPETEALLVGLEQLPTLSIPYRGVTLREFDLDAALARHPDLLLVDELAHSNAEGCRHSKRWQDVEELLAAGINVYSTLNVQHLESLNDVIAQITGVTVQETLPDHVFEQAEEIELIDLTPEELVERLREGKIYLTAQAERALRHFFQRANLTVLRELALRQSADRIHADVQSERQTQRTGRTWPTHERLVVCVGPSPTSAKVIRSAKRMAMGLRAEWIAVTVETSQTLHMSDDARERLGANLRLAEDLGADSRILSGTDAAEEIVSFARESNATKIVVGKPLQSRWQSLWSGSLVEDLLRLSGDIDVYIIRGVGEPQRGGRPSKSINPQTNSTGYLIELLATTAASCLGALLLRWHVTEANIVMVFLATVLFTSARYGRGPGILASVFGVLAFDFFLIPPYLTFAVADAQYVLTFLVLLAVSLTTSHLTARLREQVEASRLRERRTEALYKLGKQLSGAMGTDFLLLMAGQQLSQTFGGEWAVLLPDDKNHLSARWSTRNSPAIDTNLSAVATWSFEHNKPCGRGTETLPNVGALVVPLSGSQRTAGVLIGWGAAAELWSLPDSRRHLETAAGLIALALERDRLTIEARQSELDAESERLRNVLLNSLSHDLRTPLAVIAGASSSLLQRSAGAVSGLDRELLQTIYEESDRLSKLIDSLLQITRIEAGGVHVQKEWNVPEEVLGAAIRRVQQQFPRRVFELEVPPDLPLVPMDAVLIEQVCFNLLENACRYSPVETHIQLTASIVGADLQICVADRGPGLATDELERVFQKFYRGSAVPLGDQRGAGLGLAICQAIIMAHHGTIRAENRQGGGALFSLTLPRGDNPPMITDV
ncbi:MAG: Osmosensitive channel His kinase sensor [Planctomycetaceae bacterium]|nr:Osmosensitive channel His kinase sensor [Planctomycetaceae bacterium]